MSKIIGICGKKRSGKTTFTNYLLEELNKKEDNWETIAFADPIKEMIKHLGLSLDDIEEYKDKTHHIINTNTRRLMQTLGTEWGRNTISKNLWINVLDSKLNPNKNYIISDIRFKNEYNYIKKFKGLLCNIVRDDIAYNDKHPSEQLKFIDDEVITIYNNKDLDYLKVLAKIISNKI